MTISPRIGLGWAVALSVLGLLIWATGSRAASSDQRAEALLKQMTLEEKVGQMTQVALDLVSRGKEGRDEPHSLDRSKLEDALVHHHVGSILNVVNSAYSVEHWQTVISEIQDMAVHKTRLGIPVLYGIDAVHGANYIQGATLFPQSIGMAASRDRELVRKEAEIASREISVAGLRWNFYPDLDVARQPLWSRVYETYGEDTYLVTRMGVAYLQGHRDATPCLKHYLGYGFPWSGKDRTPVYLTERMIRETYLPPFEAAIQAGAPTVMVNSTEIDGVPGHANRHLLTDILRTELGFKGIVVSDWKDIENLYERDRVAGSPREAVRMAVMAGVDMSMVPLDYSFYDLLIGLVKDGQVPMSRIDQAVIRILRVKLQAGLFEHPFPDPALKGKLISADASAANLKAAQESITLLKNERETLPLPKDKRILLAGPNADLLSALNGGWTVTWQGDREDLLPKDQPTLRRAIEAKIGAKQVVYADSADQALSAASDVDAIVLALGEKAYAETPGNIEDLALDPAQIELARKLEDTGKPVILVMLEGRPRVIRPIVDHARAIVMAYLPGMEGGRAIADVLFGDVNPSGRLPFTYPRAVNSLIPYDHTPMEESSGNAYNPEFPFGRGLSYTRFTYSKLSLSQEQIRKGQALTVTVQVKNEGKRAGKEAVELYLTDRYASVARPVRQLRGFEKIELAPDETRVVKFILKPTDFSFVNSSNHVVTEPGDFEVAVEALKATFKLKP